MARRLRDGVDGLSVMGMARGTDDECMCGGWLAEGHYDDCRLSERYEEAAHERLVVLLDEMTAAAAERMIVVRP